MSDRRYPAAWTSLVSHPGFRVVPVAVRPVHPPHPSSTCPGDGGAAGGGPRANSSGLRVMAEIR